MEFATRFPFLRFAVERATHDVRGLRELARVSLRSPGVDVVLVRLVRLPRSLRLGLMWARADAVVDCVADAIDAYRLARDENYDVSDPDAEDDRLWRITRLTGPRELADALPGDLAWVETADNTTGANARPVHFLQGQVGPVWRPLGREAREKLAREKMRVIRGGEDEWGVHDRLCVARVRAGLSRAQAARQLGEDMISVGDLRDLEEGDVIPTLQDLAKLANLCDVSVEWLRGESAPSPMPAVVERSGLSEPDKAKLGDMLDAMAPKAAPRPRMCQTCQTTPVLHAAASGLGWFVECPGCGDATADHDDDDDAIEAWNRDLTRLSREPASAVPSLHTLWGRAATLGYPRRPKRWWIEVQRAQEQGHDISDVLLEAERDLATADVASAMPALSDEDRARLDEIREAVGFMQRRLEQGQGTVASAMCRLSLPMSLDLLRIAERGTASADACEQPAECGGSEPDPDGWRDVSTVTHEEWAAWRWWLWRHEVRASVTIQRAGQSPRPEHGCARRMPVLEWPEMDGQEWIEARSVTQAMVDAWPVWECNRDEYGIHVLLAAGLAVGHLAGRWRPLRLPGMSADPETLGEIAGKDMRPEHFELISRWRCWLGPYDGWSSSATAAGWNINHVDASNPDDRWIPAVLLKARRRSD